MTSMTPQPAEKVGAEDILARAQQGDRAAFEELVKSWQGRLFAFAMSIMGCEEDARDCLQETLLRLYRGIGSFRGEASFSTWLYSMTTHVCLDEMRRRRHRVRTSPLDSITEQGQCLATLPDPLESLSQSSLRQQVASVLRQVPEPYQTALVLREVGGLSYDALAGHLGCSVGTVRSRLARGRRHFRRLWQESVTRGRAVRGVVPKEGTGALYAEI